MAGFLELPQHMGARKPFVLCPCPRVFSRIYAGTINTNQCSLYDKNSAKGTINHLEMLHTTCPLVLIYLLALWSLLAKEQPTSMEALHLGPLYDCSQLRHLGIFRFPSLSNCSHNMLQQDAAYQHSQKSFDILTLLPSSQSTIAR